VCEVKELPMPTPWDSSELSEFKVVLIERENV